MLDRRRLSPVGIRHVRVHGRDDRRERVDVGVGPIEFPFLVARIGPVLVLRHETFPRCAGRVLLDIPPAGGTVVRLLIHVQEVASTVT